jgi:Fe-S-cluster containining protein
MAHRPSDTRPSSLPSFAARGLRFECTRCGGCCRGRGSVEVSDSEIEQLAGHLGLPADDFRRDYTRPIRKGRLRLENQRNRDCVFFSADRGCTVYEARPDQCRSYPFWPVALQSPEDWADEATRCEGIGRGSGVSPVEIERALSLIKVR